MLRKNVPGLIIVLIVNATIQAAFTDTPINRLARASPQLFINIENPFTKPSTMNSQPHSLNVNTSLTINKGAANLSSSTRSKNERPKTTLNIAMTITIHQLNGDTLCKLGLACLSSLRNCNLILISICP